VNFLADECCDADLVQFLRLEGHDVLYVLEFKPGAFDTEVLERAFIEKRILLTEDKDFGELVYRFKRQAFGIVLLRFDVHERSLKWPMLKELINKYGSKLEGHFAIVDSEKYRIRPLSKTKS
jgi:predicted nuclease of predicted toxin-antitoxin system